jgi:hypothetical protein
MIDTATTRATVGLVTCSAVPDLDPDDRLLVEPLADRGIRTAAAVWDDPNVDWASFDLVVLRSSWDYAPRRSEFVAWAQSVPRLVNPADVVTWNTDKSYLVDVAAHGVPVVDTRWIAPGDAWTPPDAGEWVVKPAVSAGSKDSGRYDLANPAHRDLAVAHVARLQAGGAAGHGAAVPAGGGLLRRDRGAVPGRRLLPLDPQGSAAHRAGPRRRRALQG